MRNVFDQYSQPENRLSHALAVCEVRRSDIVARCRISREVARRELAALVGLGLLRRIGFGRGTRYVRLSFWLTFISDAAEWAMAMV